MSVAPIPSSPADLELIAQLKTKLQYAEMRIRVLEERLRLMVLTSALACLQFKAFSKPMDTRFKLEQLHLRLRKFFSARTILLDPLGLMQEDSFSRQCS